MFKNILTYLVYIILFRSYTCGLESGIGCLVNGKSGECVPASECLSAKENLNKNYILPEICWYGKETYVCCATENTPEPSTTRTRRATDGCEPLTSVTAPEVGQKSWNKCLEYQEKIMRLCTTTVNSLLVEGKFRNSKCNRDSPSLILEGGVLDHEFPHMVLLGYGDDIKSLSWLCEGVIISERFILTFAVCSAHRKYGPVKYIRTGVLNMSEPVDASRLFKIKQIIKHPSYKAPSPHNDIALLEIDNDIPLDFSAIPACIDVGNLPSYEHAVGLGWDLRDRENTVLQKGHLSEASSDVCIVRGPARNLFDNTTQICYVNKNDNKNGYDFENILQIEHIKCMYVVIGMFSRRSSDDSGRPFTRVSAFVPWIESIVFS